MAMDAAARVSKGVARPLAPGRVVVIDERQRTSLALDVALDVTLRSIDLGLRTNPARGTLAPAARVTPSSAAVPKPSLLARNAAAKNS
jgi:hypothetical protein